MQRPDEPTPLVRAPPPRLRRRVAGAALLAAGLLAPLVVPLAFGLTLVRGDTASLYAPQRWLAGTALREGRLPLWNPYAGTGMPFLGETIHGVLHPVSVLAAFLAPSDATDPLLVAYVLAAGLGAAVLARTLGASRLSSAGAALVYGLSGFTLSMTDNLVFLAGAGTLPWMLAGLRAFAAGPGPWTLAAAALGTASLAFSGDVQALLVGAALGLALAFEAGGWRAALRAVGAGALGALVAGVQLAPSWAFLRQTARSLGEVPLDARWDLSPWRLLELALPGFFRAAGEGVSRVFVHFDPGSDRGYPFATSVYLGAPALLLAAAGLSQGRRARVPAVAGAVLVWLALGANLGARQATSWLPLVGRLRFSEKWLLPATLCVALLAARGLDAVVSDPRLARRVRIAALAGAAVALAALAAVRAGFPGDLLVRDAAAAADLRAHLTTGLAHLLGACAATAAWLLVLARGRVALAHAAAVLLLWAAPTAAARVALRPGHREARLGVAAPPLAAPPPGPRIFRAGTLVPRSVPADWDDDDVETYQGWLNAEPSFNVWQRVGQVELFTGLEPARYWVVREQLTPFLGALAPRYAATHLLAPPSFDGRAAGAGTLEGVDPRTGGEVRAIRHRGWASFPPSVAAVGTTADAVAELRRVVAERSATAIVEAPSPPSVAPGEVLRVERRRESLVVDAVAQGPSVLVVNDSFWPGWRATIDGVEVPVFPADVLVRAVPFPAGRHVLEMRYEPAEVRVGVALSLGGLAALAGACLYVRRRAARARG